MPDVFIGGTGIALREADAGGIADRLARIREAVQQTGRRFRLVHGIEEIALAAADEALEAVEAKSRQEMGLSMGLDEGIDEIKAGHSRAVALEGPLGASPVHFPFTAPNAVAAQLSILLGMRGETPTFCEGMLSGAAAIGSAYFSVRDGIAPSMLTGGATSIGDTVRSAFRATGKTEIRCECEGAAFLVFLPKEVNATTGATARVIGFGEGRGPRSMERAVSSCIEDSGIPPQGYDRVVFVGAGVSLIGEDFRAMGFRVAVESSPFSGFMSASVPMATTDIVRAERAGVFLVVGLDCFGGAVAIALHIYLKKGTSLG